MQAFQRDLPGVKALLGEPQEVTLAEVEGAGPLAEWNEIFRVSQGAEVWEALGEWVQRAQPRLGPGTKERFEMASQLTPEEVRCWIAISHLVMRLFLCNSIVRSKAVQVEAPMAVRAPTQAGPLEYNLSKEAHIIGSIFHMADVRHFQRHSFGFKQYCEALQQQQCVPESSAISRWTDVAGLSRYIQTHCCCTQSLHHQRLAALIADCGLYVRRCRARIV